MKKFIATALLATTMVSGAAFAQEVPADQYQNPAQAGAQQNVGGGSLNTNSNNGAITQQNSNNTTYRGDVNNNTGTVVQQPASSTSTQKIESNQAAPVALSNLTTSGHDTCFGSVTGGVSVAGFGVGGGSTVIDENCVLIKNAKLLSALGLKDAAITLLADSNEAIFEAIAKSNPELIVHLYDEARIQKAFR